MKFIRPSSNSIFNCHSPKGIKLITRLRLGLSHLREHKFRHNFQDTLNPICSCGDDIETTIHYLLHCPNYLDERRTLLDNLQSIGENIHDKNDSKSQNCFCLAFLQIMMYQIHIFWMLPSNTYWLLKYLTSLNSWVVWNIHIFSMHILILPSLTIVHTRFNDNWLLLSFFYYCHYYFHLVFFYLVLFFMKWFYNDLVNIFHLTQQAFVQS